VAIRTELTRRFGIQHPIVQAGMGPECGAPLAAAVSNAGGLGTIGTIGSSPADLSAEVEACRRATSRPFAVNVVTFDWAPFAREMLDAALATPAPIVTLSFGDPLPALERCQAAGRMTLVQVQDLAGARAVLAARPDALIVQGNEAGGHTGRRGTLSFAAQVLDLAGDVPVVVAGGIATGRGLAAVLAMGAAGAVVGTRFKVSPEFGIGARAEKLPGAEILPALKAAIVGSDGCDTIYDELLDDAHGLEWPNRVTGRALANRFTAEWAGRRAELRAAVAAAGRPFGFLATLLGDPERRINWAGESAGLVRRAMPAAEVVVEIARDAEARLRAAAGAVAASARAAGD
jgi:nitronate monooxygenase